MYTRLDREFKIKWTSALRSGEYKQGNGKLWNPKDDRDRVSKEESFCCLGVGCLVAGLKKEQIEGYALVPFAFDYIKELEPLLGSALDESCGGNPAIRELIHMNDGLRKYNGAPKNFFQIADWIDQNL